MLIGKCGLLQGVKTCVVRQTGTPKSLFSYKLVWADRDSVTVFCAPSRYEIIRASCIPNLVAGRLPFRHSAERHCYPFSAPFSVSKFLSTVAHYPSQFTMPQLLQQTVECTTSAALPALESVASYTNNPTAIASAIAEIGSYIKASALPTAAAILALAGELPSTVEDYVDTTAIEPVLVEQFSLQVWERDTLEITALREILKPAINCIKPTIDFVTAHPFALRPLLLPVLIVWLQLMGFRSGGIGAGEFWHHPSFLRGRADGVIRHSGGDGTIPHGQRPERIIVCVPAE